jgi:hypothetical protein
MTKSQLQKDLYFIVDEDKIGFRREVTNWRGKKNCKISWLRVAQLLELIDTQAFGLAVLEEALAVWRKAQE